MAYALNPFADPIGFMILYVLMNIGTEGFAVVAMKMAVMSSVISLPFVLLGQKVREKVTEMKWREAITLAATVFIIVIVFWVFLRIWYALFLTDVSAELGNPLSIIWTWISSTILLTVLAWLGLKLKKKMEEKWSMPHVLFTLIVTVIMNIVFWLAVLAIFMIV